MPDTTCARCSSAVHRPPRNGMHQCFNCGHKWAAEIVPTPQFMPGSTVEQLITALRERGAELVSLAPRRTGCSCTVKANGVQLDFTIETDAEVLPTAIASLDAVLAGIGRSPHR